MSKSVTLLSVGLFLLMAFIGNEARAVQLTREQSIQGCMYDPMDGVDKQSKEYCDCYADNYPAFAKALEEENPDAVQHLRKCDPLRTRNIQHEGEMQKNAHFQACQVGRNPGPDPYCECQAEVIKQEYIKFETANLKMVEPERTKKSVSALIERMDLADKKCKALEKNEKPSSTNSIAIPRRIEFKDENGKTHVVPAPR